MAVLRLIEQLLMIESTHEERVMYESTPRASCRCLRTQCVFLHLQCYDAHLDPSTSEPGLGKRAPCGRQTRTEVGVSQDVLATMSS